MKYRTLYTPLLFTLTVLVVSGCSSTKLLNINETSTKLNFTKTQHETIKPKVKKIAAIIEEYESAKRTLESEMQGRRNQLSTNGSLGGGGMRRNRQGSGTRGTEFQTKIQEFYKQRTKFMNQINTLVTEIQAVLNDSQRAAFASIKLPHLELPEIGGAASGSNRRRGDSGTGGGRRRGSNGFGGGF